MAYTRIQRLIGTTSEWDSYNPVLLDGEAGYEKTTTGEWKVKLGDGESTWSALSYAINFSGNLADIQEKLDAALAAQTAAETAETNAETAQAAAELAYTNIQTAIAGKVDIDDIVNDLTTGGTAVPLSAEQGKTLSTSISELNTKVIEKTSYGVYTGLGVTQQTVADMTVKVATGTIYMADGTRFTPTANNTLAVTTADATNPRIDIVYVNSSGVIAYLAGTAAASPSAPSVPTGGQLLAQISVAANATTIVTDSITDKRRLNWQESWITPTLLNGWVAVDAVKTPVRYYKDSFGNVHLKGQIQNGTLRNIFSLPAGYRVSGNRCFPKNSVNSTGKTLEGVEITDNMYINAITIKDIIILDGVTFRAEA